MTPRAEAIETKRAFVLLHIKSVRVETFRLFGNRYAHRCKLRGVDVTSQVKTLWRRGLITRQRMGDPTSSSRFCQTSAGRFATINQAYEAL